MACSMDLVNWMEDCYTAEQQLIVELKEENKKLKDELKRVGDDADVFVEEMNEAHSLLDALIEVIDDCYGGGRKEFKNNIGVDGVKKLTEAGLLVRAPFQCLLNA